MAPSTFSSLYPLGCVMGVDNKWDILKKKGEFLCLMVTKSVLEWFLFPGWDREQLSNGGWLLKMSA